MLLPLYLQLFPQAKILHIVRNSADIGASLSHKSKQGVGVLNDPDHWAELADQHVERVRSTAKASPDSPHLEVAYEHFCRQPVEICDGIFEFVGLPFTSEARDFLLSKVHKVRFGTSRRSSLR